jgi:hypothetical protein
MRGGWFIGDFEPSVLRTKDFEVSVRSYRAGDTHDAHFHAIATEINVVAEGCVIIGKNAYVAGDIFVVDPMETVDPVFTKNTTIVCVKTPSVVGDKYPAKGNP